MRAILLFITLLSTMTIISQEVSGKVLDDDNMPVVGANVYWIDQSAGTVTDIDGKYKLENPSNIDKYVISYIGFFNDTISSNYISQKIYLQKVRFRRSGGYLQYQKFVCFAIKLSKYFEYLLSRAS